ncbi:hypothetical protein B296_00007287 [Ensete ventricosum]|uniref:Plastocyanin-like domain-containing protein n=1 Tax=Ensete ventricosum TaxID=4639 RepID=A0A426ZX56_ENSVE|nr:hypothetical protein B296_00007287 [Ensete ventricosum]
MVFLTRDFLMFRQNVSVSGVECGVGDVVEREDSRPCDAAGGGGRLTHPAEHLLLLRSPFGPVLLVPRHGRSATHGLLHRGLVPVHEHRAVNHRRPPLQWNLTASGPRPNPQGSYHYGLVNTTRTIRLANSAPVINGKQRYAVNSVSFIPADTPLKVVDFYNIAGVFSLGSMPDNPTYGAGYLQTSVMAANFRDYVEIIFENSEDTLQSWHIDGYSFWVVG